ncbi:MAG TPA: HPr(Ser) kinase/phosphatase, partial [Thiotrichales bacterium]|nr:HPr(Ser) kinase/phosphatase [Thiotrichales bacterium]
MSEIFSAESIIVNLASKIELKWIAGSEDPGRPLHEVNASEHATLIGHLNLIHKNMIQVIGKTECQYLQNLEDGYREKTLSQIFTGGTVAVILTDGLPVPDILADFANNYNIPLLSSEAPSNEVVDTARYFLNAMFSHKEIIHGVFMEVLGIGVLITGESSVGKSELALELITRGHRLIADDAPEFTVVGPGILDGRSPGILKDYMEVRGLGVLNIREMYGENALKLHKFLRLILHLQRMNIEDRANIDRLQVTTNSRTILGVDVPETLLPVAPGRNLAVLAEAAVHNHILQASGRDASKQLIDLQQ